MSSIPDDTLTYLKENNIAQLMEHILRNITTDRPAEPTKYIHDLLERPVPPQIIIAGPPGSGKGTQSRFIAKRFGAVHVSSGDLLRAEVQNNTDAGKIAEPFLKSGKLVPDKLITGMIRRRLEQDDVKERGWLLDGYPRTREQAEALEAAGIAPHVFILLDVPEALVVERIEHRRTDPTTGAVYHLLYNPPPQDDTALCGRLLQRVDDRRDTVEARLKIYNERLTGLQKHYGRIIEIVGGERSIDDVKAAVLEAVERRRLR